MSELPKSLRSVETALAVLTALSEGDAEHSISELGRTLGISKAGVYRALITLQRSGFVRQNERTDNYALTLKCWSIGVVARENFALGPLAEPYLLRLRDDVRATIYVAAYEDGRAVYITTVQTPQAIGVLSTTGGVAPAHCVSTGKVLLAHISSVELNAVLKRGLKKYTARTCTDRRKLLHELEIIRDRGYAVNRGEWRPQVAGVAAPIRNHDGSVIAALGACGPMDDFSEKRSVRVIERVTAVAEEISVHLGWRAYRAVSVAARRGSSSARGRNSS